jgi:hypothetical protein
MMRDCRAGTCRSPSPSHSTGGAVFLGEESHEEAVFKSVVQALGAVVASAFELVDQPGPGRQFTDRRGTGVPLASRPAPSQRGTEAVIPNRGVQASPAARLLPGQRVRIGDMSMSSLGAPQRLYITFQAAVARFDVVAAEGLRDAGIMEKVLAGMDDGWEAAVSRSGYFGFIYSDKIQMVRDLGTYPEKGEFLHAPYAAQFRLVGTRFRVNLVLCHIEPDRDRKTNAAEIALMADVHRHFEDLTGNRGITLLLAGGLRDHGQRMFASAPLRLLIEKSGFGASTPPVAYVTLGAGK